MKFTVGYPLRRNDRFISQIIENSERIAEVYFSFGGIANGRGSGETDEYPLAAAERQLSELSAIAAKGVGMNLLLNGGCYGGEALSRAFFMSLGDTIDFLRSKLPLGSVTTTSPIIGKFLHANFPGIEVRASVNIGVGTVQAMDSISEYFDGFYLKRELNRDFAAIKRLKRWCDDHSKGLYLLANSGCFNDCPARTFHDNLVAHEAEIARADNGYSFNGICREYLSSAEKRISLIRDTSYIRPEDIHLYEEFFDSVKLATRVNPNPVRLLSAYLDRVYRGAVTDLLEPDNGSALLPVIVDSSRFPADFAEKLASCGRDCESCGYCQTVLERASVTLE